MDAGAIRGLFAYNRWANARILGAVDPLDAEQFLRDLGSSFRSVRDTLVHILSAEWIWLERWRGTSPAAMFDPAAFPTLERIRARWRDVEAGQAAFVDAATNDRLQAPVAYRNTRGERWEYPLWQLMAHVVNHSTYHRGQITTLLRQLGAQAVATDLLVFYDRSRAV